MAATLSGGIVMESAEHNRQPVGISGGALLSPFAIGMGTLVMGLREAQPELIEAGRAMAAIGLALFLAFGACSELLFFRGAPVSGIIWPVVLIAAGLILLFVRGQRQARQ